MHVIGIYDTIGVRKQHMNINYKLALELKEAGFPYKGSYLSFYIDGVLSQDYRLPSGESIIYIPTLSELIDKLPDHCGVQRDDWGWCMYVKGTLNTATISDSPEEAVAKLWLALNKD